MDEDLVSIIVPMYNCEKYITNTIKTIIEQTYSKIEILLIDDGSTDSTYQKCKEFEKDKRIQLIKQKNAGVSATRNNGLTIAKGKFIVFVDADDYLEKNMIENLVDIYKKNKTDLVTCGFFSEIIDKDKVQLSDPIYVNTKYYKNKEMIKQDFVELWDKHILYNVWNKMYLNKVIKENNIKFPNYNWGEDIQFNRDYLKKIKQMYNTEKCYYHYIRARKESITEKYNENLYKIRVKEYEEFVNYFKEFGIKEEEYQEFVARRHIERIIGCVENIENRENKTNFFNKYKIIKQILNDDLTKKCLCEAKPKSKKIKIILIPYKYKLTLIVMLTGRMLSIIKRKLPTIFNFFKNRR